MNKDPTAETPIRRRRWWLPVLILVVAGVAAAGLIATKPKQQPVKVGERAWLVSVETPRRASHVPNVTLFGKVESLWSSDLTAALTADVLEVASIEGDAVTRGQLLVRLDDRDARLQLAQREAELAQAQARIDSEMRRHEADLETLPREMQLLALTRSEVARLRNLVKKKVGAQSQLDTARQAAERQAIAVTASRPWTNTRRVWPSCRPHTCVPRPCATRHSWNSNAVRSAPRSTAASPRSWSLRGGACGRAIR